MFYDKIYENWQKELNEKRYQLCFSEDTDFFIVYFITIMTADKTIWTADKNEQTYQLLCLINHVRHHLLGNKKLKVTTICVPCHTGIAYQIYVA